MRTPLLLLASAALALVVSAAPVGAYVPQTITVDGINDFLPANLIDADGGDTETKNWCTNDPGVESPMDLLDIYVTNDNSFLYVGYFYDRDCFSSPQVNLGFALDVNDTTGTVTDPFNRKIRWDLVTNKPDYVMYDVMDGFNYEVLYERLTRTTWANVSTEVNPAWGGGSQGLGVAEGCPCSGGGSLVFVEFKLPLSVFNVTRPTGLEAGDLIYLEWWMTQDGTTKPPLDCAFSDSAQKSTPAGTTFDVTTAVQMIGMHPYTILALTDVTPPTVSSACAVGFPLQPDRTFGLTTSSVDVSFSEPVDLTTSQNTANYAITNIGGATVTGAVRDATVQSLVHLTLSAPIGASASFRDVTVTGVKDLANNTIVNDGTTNVKSFFIQAVTFQGDVSVGLCKGIFAPADTFSVEGNLNPLTFGICDNALMSDANVDSVYETTVPFCMQKGGNGRAEAALEWKLARLCSEYEPGGNRPVTLSSDNGATTTVFAFWNNDDPVNFTIKPIDVIFQVDATLKGPGTVTLMGSQSPLSFVQPGVVMSNIGGNIYQATVRFPTCTAKNVQWKVDHNGVLECFGQGDRNVYLNDQLYGIVGSPEGPITLPARGIDRCTVTDKAIKVIFKIDSRIIDPDPTLPADSLVVAATPAPLSFTVLPDVDGVMFDNGVNPDAVAGDKIFTRAVTFPDSTVMGIEYKYWLNREDGLVPITGASEFECPGFGNRWFELDDLNYSVAVPMVRPLNYWNYCSDVTGVPDESPRPAVLWATLGQNYPNPFNPTTTISFELRQSGPTLLAVYDVSGRRIATLMEKPLDAGTHQVVWNGQDDAGRVTPSGIYFYELSQGNLRLARRMTVVQ